MPTLNNLPDVQAILERNSEQNAQVKSKVITLDNSPYSPTLAKPLTSSLRSILAILLDEWNDGSGWRYAKNFCSRELATQIKLADPHELFVHVEMPEELDLLAKCGIIPPIRSTTGYTKALVWEIKDWKTSETLLAKRKAMWTARDEEQAKKHRNIKTLVASMRLLMGDSVAEDYLVGKALTILKGTSAEVRANICKQFNITLE